MGLGLCLSHGQALRHCHAGLIRIYGLARAASLINAALFSLGQSDAHADIAVLYPSLQQARTLAVLLFSFSEHWLWGMNTKQLVIQVNTVLCKQEHMMHVPQQ